jgi:hypothetical protein
MQALDHAPRLRVATPVSALVAALAAALLAALAATILMAWAALSPAAAMSFSTVALPNGTRIVLAKGPVTAGDAKGLRDALQSADRDASGNKVLALDSPGGLIIESFAMVDVMDKERVSTVVQTGASCASACAQILFLSGSQRTVEGSGRIGLHSCHTAGDNSRSMVCNELIAQNALARGTPYGAIMAFMTLVDAKDMRWLGAVEADCWGFTKGPTDLSKPAKPVPVRACF